MTPVRAAEPSRWLARWTHGVLVAACTVGHRGKTPPPRGPNSFSGIPLGGIMGACMGRRAHACTHDPPKGMPLKRLGPRGVLP